jgi:hypothetical protein
LFVAFLAAGYLAYRVASRAVEEQTAATKALIDLRRAEVQNPPPKPDAS